MGLSARITPESDAIIHELVAKTGKRKIIIIQEALEQYRFHERMRMFNEAYGKLRTDKALWKQELAERGELEGTLSDGLDEE